jgi:hypothetical protein
MPAWIALLAQSFCPKPESHFWELCLAHFPAKHMLATVFGLAAREHRMVDLIAEECAPHGADRGASPYALPPIQGGSPLAAAAVPQSPGERGCAMAASGRRRSVPARDGTRAQVAICDRGPGCRRMRGRPSQHFYRLRHVPESAGSAGFGLPSSARSASAMAGSAVHAARGGRHQLPRDAAAQRRDKVSRISNSRSHGSTGTPPAGSERRRRSAGTRREAGCRFR